MTIRVLYIHHAGPFGGASRSLFELISNFPEGCVDPFVLTRQGQFVTILQDANIKVLASPGISQFDHTLYSHYRGFRWLVLLREILYFPSTLLGLWRAKRQWPEIDLVHINDITLLPCIFFAKHFFSCPLIVHVRSVQAPLFGVRGRFLKFILKRNVDQFISIDETVKRSLEKSLNVVTVHNGLRKKTGLDSTRNSADVPVFGMVGGLSLAKGCLDFIEAAKICKRQGFNAKFVFVGKSMRPPARIRDFVLKLFGISQEIETELKHKIELYELQDRIEFWPFTLNLAEVYPKFDCLCFPSHFDAPGRPIFEAALYERPSIAAITHPTSDTIVNGETGFVVEPKNPEQLAQAMMKLIRDPELGRNMGKAASALADTYFNIERNAATVVSVYDQILSRPS